jgi:hypothetical protein
MVFCYHCETKTAEFSGSIISDNDTASRLYLDWEVNNKFLMVNPSFGFPKHKDS